MWERGEEGERGRDVQLLEHFPSIHKVLDLTLSTTLNWPWWCTPEIPSMQEVETEGSEVQKNVILRYIVNSKLTGVH